MHRILKYATIIFWLAVAYFSFLLVLICWQYTSLNTQEAFLIYKQSLIVHWWYKLAFYTHVFTASLAIVAGAPQFWAWLRHKKIKLHRLLGKIYVAVILCAAAPSGLVLSAFAVGGFWAQVPFTLLSVLWWYTTYKAFAFAKNKNIKAHQRMAIRSYALTLSAITLRVVKMLLVKFVVIEPMLLFCVIAWSGLVINGIIAEVVIWSSNIGNTISKSNQ